MVKIVVSGKLPIHVIFEVLQDNGRTGTLSSDLSYVKINGVEQGEDIKDIEALFKILKEAREFLRIESSPSGDYADLPVSKLVAAFSDEPMFISYAIDLVRRGKDNKVTIRLVEASESEKGNIPLYPPIEAP